MRIVLLGAPGSGKGTQAQRLMAERGLVQVSTGDLLRAAVAEGTELGRKAKAAMDAGDLVSDDVVLGMIRERLSREDAAAGFILDGFPRNRAQAEALESVLQDIGRQLDAAVLMKVDFSILMQRLTGRRTCSLTGRVLNVHFSPQSAIDECLRNGGELLRRDDDNAATIANRLEVYRQQTEPVIGYYRERHRLLEIDAEGEVDEVYRRLLLVLRAG
jgi:adenylate kinase